MIEILSSAIALLAVCVSAYAVWESKRTQLNAAYFSEKTQAYSNFLTCASDFVLDQTSHARNRLAASLYQLQLFAPAEIQELCQECYKNLIDAAAHQGFAHGNTVWADQALFSISESMKTDLASFRKR